MSPFLPCSHFPDSHIFLQPCLSHVYGTTGEHTKWESLCVSKRTTCEDAALGAAWTVGRRSSRSLWAAGLGQGEAFGAESVEASSQLFLLGWPLMEGRGLQSLTLSHSRREIKKSCANTFTFNYLLIIQEMFPACPYILGCPSPGMSVMRGQEDPEARLCPISLPPRS